MGWFIRKPRLLRRPRFTPSIRVGPVRIRKNGGSVSAGPVGYSWRSKRRKR